MKLVVGLGNPGAEYERSRHNFGFVAADFVAKEFGVKFAKKPKFRAEIAEAEIDGEKVIFAKPQTFYNLSGETAQKIREFYKVANCDILVIHDDMDLPVGQIRTRKKGAAAGNNGVENLIANLGADFARIRIGSGKAADENGTTRERGENSRDYVLARPTKNEVETLREFLPQIAEIVKDFANGNFAETTYKN